MVRPLLSSAKRTGIFLAWHVLMGYDSFSLMGCPMMLAVCIDMPCNKCCYGTVWVRHMGCCSFGPVPDLNLMLAAEAVLVLMRALQRTVCKTSVNPAMIQQAGHGHFTMCSCLLKLSVFQWLLIGCL